METDQDINFHEFMEEKHKNPEQMKNALEDTRDAAEHFIFGQETHVFVDAKKTFLSRKLLNCLKKCYFHF